MSQPRRQDEIDLFAKLREQATKHDQVHGRNPGLSHVIRIAGDMGMADGRLEYLLEKWTVKCWWDYGVTACGGWFLPEAPERLDA